MLFFLSRFSCENFYFQTIETLALDKGILTYFENKSKRLSKSYLVKAIFLHDILYLLDVQRQSLLMKGDNEDILV